MSNELNSKNLTKKTPEGITPKDDAFHGSIKRLAAEWWYFDAIFDNGYAIHIGCMTFSKKKRGNASQVLEIYKHGKLIFGKRKKNKFKNFKTSREIPLVKIDNESFIEFDQEEYKKNSKWIYHLLLKLENAEIKLKFTGTTKGWKIETDKESWTVATPKAEVLGEIILDGECINVKGIGYHDHNWNYTLLTLLTYGKGWYWTRIMSKTFNVTLANIIRSSSKSVILSVVNQENNGYININPKKIDFNVRNYKRYHRKKIPTEFDLHIKDKVNDKVISINIILKTKEIHFEKRSLFMYYWRFLVSSEGFISIDSKKEKVNDSQIIELLKFR